MVHPVLAERASLCNLFEELGPDAPTRCDGWQTSDLAAHLWARENRPDAGPGLVLGGVFKRHTGRVEASASRRGYDRNVAALRSGPPFYWPGSRIPTLDAHEWFVHHEDVRRSNGGEPRELGDLDGVLWSVLGRWGKQLTRGLSVGVRLETPDGRSRIARAGDREVVLTGEPGELMLRLFGRDAEVTVGGEAAAVDDFERGSFGV